MSPRAAYIVVNPIFDYFIDAIFICVARDVFLIVYAASVPIYQTIIGKQ